MQAISINEIDEKSEARLKLSFFKGNIVDAVTDAIVLPANTALREGSGASTAIFQAAGRKQLTEACKMIGKCEVGSAAVTPGFNLNADVIVHAVVPKWIDGEHDEYALLSSAYLSALEIADSVNCRSIAFPLLASGNNGFDMRVAFWIAMKSIEAFRPKCLENVQLILYGNYAASMVQKEGFKCVDLVANESDRPIRNDSWRKRGDRAVKIVKEGAGVLTDFALDALEAGVEYMKKEENRKKILEMGLKIARIVLG